MLGELLATEESYVEDLHSVLCGYRDRLDRWEQCTAEIDSPHPVLPPL